jgi:hypothetical protein
MRFLDLPKELNSTDVFIEVFAPDSNFVITGMLMEGHISGDLVKETDMVCLRYYWDLGDYIDVEVYGNGRNAWYRLSKRQFNKIKNFLHEIHEV